MIKTPLTKYLCVACGSEFLTQEQPPKIEKTMTCMFCNGHPVIPVAGPYEDEEGLYEEMGCLYPGGL